jgi:mannose-1-phosphate guanylyltransferase
MPVLAKRLIRIRKSLDSKDLKKMIEQTYSKITAQSIDYGIMEKARNVYIIRGSFGWSDLGSWEQIYKLSDKDEQGNAVSGDTVLMESKNTLVFCEKGLLAVLGMEGIAVIQSEGATLICPRNRAEEVKNMVELLRSKKKNRYI